MDTSCTVRALSPSCSHRSVLVGRTGKGPLDPRLVGSSFNLGAFFGALLALLCFAARLSVWLLGGASCRRFTALIAFLFCCPFSTPARRPTGPQTLMSTKRRPPLPNTTAKLGFVVPRHVGKLMTLAVPYSKLTADMSPGDDGWRNRRNQRQTAARRGPGGKHSRHQAR